MIVVRYFGGVKLGVGGLISAYRNAADIVLNNSKIIEKEITTRINLTFNYPAMADVMRMVNDYSMSIINQNFQDECAIELEYPVRFENDVREKVNLMEALGKVNLH